MQFVENPFFTKIIIPDKFFCDREKDTQTLLNLIKNGYNIVLKSPRRLGKSSLIMHIFNKEEIRASYNTLFVDIYGTKNMQEFTREFQNAFMEAPFAIGKRGAKKVEQLLGRAYVQMNISQDGAVSGFRLGLNPAQEPDMYLPLREMFSFLEKTNKPNIVVFDEFQTILDYPEKAAAIIRSLVQKLSNTSFIFSGSASHLLDKMFEYPNEPFYRSATPLNLQPIPLEIYQDFAVRMFGMYGKDVEREAVGKVYHLFSANTYDIQEVMKGAFSITAKRKTAGIQTVIESINDILDRRDVDFRGILDRLGNVKERSVLFCIAREGIATGLMSSAMIGKYRLDNASSVQNALKSLTSEEKNLVKRIGNGYMLRDRFFELWIARSDRRLPLLVDNADLRYRRELELMA